MQMTPENISKDQWFIRLEEWSSREQLMQCESTLYRFYMTGYSIEEAVVWLKEREKVLAECDSLSELDDMHGME
jgi:hypothetical protein